MASTAFHGKLSYHDYEGPSLDLDERGRLLKNLGDNQAMMLRNHGILTTGRTVPEAFIRLYRLERACQIQVDAGAAGTLNVLGDNLAAKSGADMDAFSERESGGLGVPVTDEGIFEAQRALAGEEGLYAEPSALVGLTAVMQLARQRALSPEQRVVVVLTSGGLKDFGASRGWLPEVPSAGPDFDSTLAVLDERYGLDLRA